MLWGENRPQMLPTTNFLITAKPVAPFTATAIYTPAWNPEDGNDQSKRVVLPTTRCFCSMPQASKMRMVKATGLFCWVFYG